MRPKVIAAGVILSVVLTASGPSIAHPVQRAESSAAGAGAPQASTLTDSSPHQVKFVTVDASVRLEVLDWGGTGRPILFVPAYMTAHAFDDIAPKLTDQFHVYAITRRGLGASDRRPSGYDPQRRADDILEVINAFGMTKPILIGHAGGGAILDTLGAQHSDRLGALVYLDAAVDPTLTEKDYALPFPDMTRLPPRATPHPAPLVFPEGERLQMRLWPLDPVIRRALTQENHVRPEYARIRVPVLAIYRTESREQALKDYPPRNVQEREAFDQVFAAGQAMLSKWQGDLRAGVPTARIVELPGANLFMFISNEADVIREVRALAATLR